MELSRRALLAMGVAASGGIAGCLSLWSESWESPTTLSLTDVTLVQDPYCACCEDYATYLSDHVEGTVDRELVDDPTPVKEQLGIDSDLWSCHTVLADDYIIEGHMPVEVIEQLLEDPSNPAGIALPGMPPGSPGMAGRKTDTWTVFEIRPGEAPTTYTTV